MESVCIVTDSTIQFPQPAFAGRNLVKILPLKVNLSGECVDEYASMKNSTLPATATRKLNPSLSSPSSLELTEFINTIGKSFDQTLWILHSSALGNCCQQIQERILLLSNHERMQIIDSRNISIGLGLLVQAAAELAECGTPLSEIERVIRTNIPLIYTVLCIPNLSYLYFAGLIDLAQATIGEMMGILPIFTLENGKLTPVEKVKNNHQIYDFFQEFINEFDQLHHLALLQNASPDNQNPRILRDFIQNNFPKTYFTEHNLTLPIATLFGPHCTGLFIAEADKHKGIKRYN
jgi:DegV family protein with EDD domain